ncbi:MAG TPA: general secretion pathway protein GspB [Luteimonas sp.]|nr:general secretion pathway protein GspB [Luteimonas sp.]
MSLILEALRKSEAERRRGQAPDLHAELPPVSVPRRAVVPPWAWLLLGSALLLLALWLARAPRPSRTATTETTNASAASKREVSAPSPLPAVPRLSPSAAAARPASIAPAPVERAQPTSTPEVVPPDVIPPDVTRQSVAATPQPAPITATPAPAAVATTPVAATDSDILQLSDLSAAERKTLPPLKLSMHLWNDDPALRFVILDGTRLVEGDRIGDAVVAAITSDGVLLDWNGRRLKLPIR